MRIFMAFSALKLSASMGEIYPSGVGGSWNRGDTVVGDGSRGGVGGLRGGVNGEMASAPVATISKGCEVAKVAKNGSALMERKARINLLLFIFKIFIQFFINGKSGNMSEMGARRRSTSSSQAHSSSASPPTFHRHPCMLCGRRGYNWWGRCRW